MEIYVSVENLIRQIFQENFVKNKVMKERRHFLID